MTRFRFIDVSGYNPQARNVSFWLQAKAKGVRGAMVKLSEGTYYRNPYGTAQLTAAKQAGMKLSGYHFARFVGNSWQAKQEAQYAINTAHMMGLQPGSHLALDYELRAGYRSSNTEACIVFCQAIKQAGYIPTFYSYSGMSSNWDYEAVYRATMAAFWLAAYPHTGPTFNPDYRYFPGISTHIDAWQDTDDLFGWGVDGSVDLTGVFTTAQKVTKGGSLDDFSFNDKKIHVSGWFGSDKAQGKPYAYVILVAEGYKPEFARQKVTLVDRPDVAKAYPDMPGASKSGFNADFDYTDAMVGKKLVVIFRYTDDPGGNGHTEDYAVPIRLDKSAASQDGVGTMTFSDKLTISGWFATDMSLGLDKRFMILYDRTTRQEVERLKVQSISRPDVKKVHKDIYGADVSGFNGEFDYSSKLVGHDLQAIFRYSDADNGEGNRVDYRFPTFKGPQMPVLDGKTQYTVRASEVNLTGEDGHYLIKMK